jgi:demethylmenaquinone methyltransferase/2-methoxy-6-polyprenyl-1,4-benzoquinol methylase
VSTDAPAPPTSPSQAAPAQGWTRDELAANPHASEQKAEKVRAMFASIAKAYDLNNRLHSFGRDAAWRRRTVRLAEVKPTDRVLDVACGTGELTRAFRWTTDAERVVGLDYTAEMLEIARAKRVRPGVEYVQGDATTLPFEDGSFDVVSIAFGIRNVQAPARAFAEFRRVLRPGGRLLVLEFSRPKNPIVRAINDFYSGWLMPRTATLISGDTTGAYYYLPRSVESFLSPEQLGRMALDAGFVGVAFTPMTCGIVTITRAVVPA